MSCRWAKFGALALVVLLVAPATSFAGDAFVKLGITLDEPAFAGRAPLDGLGDRWFFSGGTAWGVVEESIFLGFDIQTAVHTGPDVRVGGEEVRSVPLNLFGTATWKAPTQSVRPYAGIGLGWMSEWAKVNTGQFMDEQEHFSDFGMEIHGGVELDRKFAVEIQGQKPFGDAPTSLQNIPGLVFPDYDAWVWSVLFGYRF